MASCKLGSNFSPMGVSAVTLWRASAASKSRSVAATPSKRLRVASGISSSNSRITLSARCKLSTTPNISRAKLMAPNFKASLRSRAARLRVFSNSARLRKSWSLTSASRSSAVGALFSTASSAASSTASSGAFSAKSSLGSGATASAVSAAPLADGASFVSLSCGFSSSLIGFPYRLLRILR